MESLVPPVGILLRQGLRTDSQEPGSTDGSGRYGLIAVGCCRRRSYEITDNNGTNDPVLRAVGRSTFHPSTPILSVFIIAVNEAWAAIDRFPGAADSS